MTSRSRRALAAAALVAFGAAGAGCGAATEAAHHDHHAAAASAAAWRPKAGLALRDPRQLYARDGVLKVDLTAARGRIVVSGSSVVAQPFNGQFVGPTLHVRPGDTIEATIHNKTDAQTNIHYHGLHVSPTGLSDNVFRTFEPGSRSRSVVRVPADHDTGTFWYHVHFHGLSEGQLAGGLSGLLIVDGLERLLPAELQGVPQRQLAIRNLELVRPDTVATLGRDVSPGKRAPQLVNGLLRPALTLRSGATELWRLANVGPDAFYDVSLEGHRLTVIAEDGSPVWTVRSHARLLIPPGKRFDVLVQGSAKPGSYRLLAHRYDGFAPQPTTSLATVTVTGPAVAVPPLALPRTLPTGTTRLDDATIARRRRFVFSFGRGRTFRALINGKQFDPMAMPVAARLGTVEEWTLENTSDEDHPFHIHVNDFQVMSVNGKRYAADGLQDVVTVDKLGGSVVIRNSFDDYSGHFVFHCHILGHEDAGMMKTIEVLRRGQQPTPPPMAGMKHHDHGM
ncbi:multicopper oxidase family protein [Conexibacter sp. JD483]|uniref:multicopper oxidase family protein n=1 Tax=unclassified Conexibacter TaxID=2627773 RepID=UPI00271CDAEE|nr:MULTISPECIES: multicopper oxidase family protein [unclassified Conexibacter]MDO8186924.1 multicopper oxidase family protein [Conexibacter sp. CPCC 205706]MDO8200621.1 multicopper oxidase family protein [Conexibacter sp. CPCC 205762]MDR9368801.1 multicopper oxidase family protein [Conexibacter sp. JD483]